MGMEGGAYAGPKAGSEARSNGSLTTQVGDIEAVKAQFAREHAPSWRARTWEHLKADVDADKAHIQLALFCLITGWLDGVSFAAAFIFAGFQTGNTVQLAAAITRLFSGPDQGLSFHMADRLALTSLLTFAGGAFLGRIGDRIGSKTRLWVMGATALQAGFCAAAFVAFIVGDVASFATDRGDVAWHSVPAFIGLGFLSASMGMQGIVGKRLNTHYGTTVVLTTIWCELVADPKLFHFGRAPSRDHRFQAVAFLFLGAFASRSIVNSVNAECSVGIAAAIKLLIAISFWWVPNKGAKKQVPGGL